MDHTEVQPAPRRRRLPFFAAVVGIAALLAVGGWCLLRPAPPPPPTIDRTDVDPEVAQAIGAAREAVLRAPRSGPAWGRLGMVLAAHGFEAEAVAALTEAERLDPREPRWPYLAGAIRQSNEPEVGVAELRRAADLSRQHAVRLRLAEALLALGRVEEAEGLFRQVERADRKDLRAQFGLAEAARAQGDPTGSLDRLRRVADEPGGHPKAAHSLMAEIYGRLGQAEEATHERQIVAHLPDDPPWPDPFAQEVAALCTGRQARIERASQLRRAGQVGEAVKLARENVRRYPDADLAWIGLGLALLQAHDYQGAEQAYGEAIRRRCDRSEAYLRRGMAIYFQRDRRPEALTKAADDFRQAIRRSPSAYLPHYFLGLCLQELGDREGAAGAYGVALRSRPEFADAHRNLGRLLAEAARGVDAAASWQRLLGEPAALDLGTALRAQARAHLRDATRLEPQDREARQALDRLEAEFPVPSPP